MQALSEKFLTLSEASDLLKKRAKEQKGGAPLSYEQQNSLEYCDKFGTLSEKDVKAMRKELQETGINEKQIVKLIDLLPAKEDELKTVLMGGGELPAADKLKEILKICKSYKPQAK